MKARTRKNRYLNLLKSEPSKPAFSDFGVTEYVAVSLLGEMPTQEKLEELYDRYALPDHHYPHFLDFPYLDRQYEKSKVEKSAPVQKPFKRVTIANAPKTTVIAAYHGAKKATKPF